MASPTTPSPADRIADGTASGTWQLDPAASTVATATKHFWGLITVRGTFADKTGHAEISPDGTITATLDVDAASIDTKHTKRDDHLRSADFFDTDHHPTITFTTTDVTLDGSTAQVRGTVTAGGARQDVTFPAQIAVDDDRATITADDITVDHRALGMTWSPLGMAKPTTTLTLALQFTRG